ncbi:hypothetical protein PGT21_035673 [Puccinia graminis f. sp. tritici]|uniref:Uncharacterized protein n=1 Tax=Puccinia graminis f. sp. tritici TaxID=56615 RepID=A0A5B0NEA8_PUCGR|nr:hypothetical protein PGT21_035673 [Puccinia graminis f. sp. tritici]
MPNWFGNCIVRALAKTYQPCHRCDRARSAISVPSPRHTSSSPWYGSDLTGSYLLPSAHVSGPRYCHRRFLCLEFKQPPPNLDFDLVTRPTRHFVDPFSTVYDAVAVLHPPLVLASVTFNPTSFDPPISQPLRASISVLMSSLAQWKPPWVGIVPAEIFVPALLSGIKTGLASSLSFLPHQLTSSSFNAINNRFPTFNLTSHYHTACSSLTTPYPTTITNPSSSLTASIMSLIFDNCDTNDFYCEGRSDPSIDIGVRYYPDRDQWSPVFNPNVVPNDDAVGDQAPTNPVSDKDPVDVKPTVDAKEKGPAEATVDPASINTILACSASLVYIPKGMEIVETRTHYFPLKDKWHAINDPSRRYDCVRRSDPSIDIGVRYYPDRDQWSPVFNPNVVPNDDAVGDQAPTNPVSDKDPVDVKPTVDAKEKGPAEATVDPASINTILACSASLVYIPKGMEIVETRTHYFPLKDKWHAINDPSRRYDCVPIPRLFPKPHPFVCVPWSVHDPELPPGLPVPFLRNLNPSVPAPSQPPSTSSSDSSSNDSASSSTYPLISNYINLNHQAVQKLLLDDNTPPAAVCIYTEEDIGVRYYPDRDQWSPVFNPNVVPNDDAVGDQAPTNPVSDKDPVDVKPTVDAKEKGPAEATVDPASINTILACSASLVYIPKGMEIVETRTHYFPLKDKWHAINDPSRRYDCVPIPRLFPKPHPFVCVPWSVHDPELPPGLPVPFLRNLNPSVPAPSQPPSTSSSDSSSNDSASSSTYPLISNYINLNHQAVQKLLLDDNTPPAAVCIYTEEDVMHIFEGIAPEYVDMCSEYPPSSLAESDRRVMFFENMQWFFRNKRSTYLSTRKF